MRRGVFLLIALALLACAAGQVAESTPEPESESEVTAEATAEAWPETTSDDGVEEKKASFLDQNAVETALFILVAVCFVFLVAFIMVLINYCETKKALEKLQMQHSKPTY